MKKNLNKFGFFDFMLFNYMLKSMTKNIGLYICSSIYLITIFVIVFIIPYFSGISPNQILLNPIVLSVTVFSISIVSTFLGIVLFKSPIDDGTELLIVSKPLSRLEILNTKIIIFLISTIFLSFLGALFSLFIFLNKNTVPYNNLFIFLGFFVGSLISFSFFGYFSLIICLFAKKILVFISSCGLAMFFLLITTLNSLTSTNPVKNMYAEGKKIKSKIWINKTKNNKPHISTLSNLNTTYDDDNETLDDAWKLAKRRSNYYRNTYFDFGAQLSSFFLLIDNITYAEWLISSMEHFSTPYNIEYKRVNLMNTLKDSNYTLSIKIKDDVFVNQVVNNQIENIPPPTMDDFNAIPIVERFFYFNIDSQNYSYEQSETYIYSGDWSEKLWDDTWKRFNDDEEKNSNKNHKTNLSNVYNRFLNYIIRENKLRKEDSKKFSNLLIDIAKSAMYKVFESHNSKVNDNKNIGDKINLSRLNLFNLYDIREDIDSNLKMSNLFLKYDESLTNNNKFKQFIDFLKSNSGINNLDKETKIVDIVNGLENNSNQIYNKLRDMAKNRLELKVLLSLLSVYYPQKINNNFVFDDFRINNIVTTSWNSTHKLIFEGTSYSVPVTFELPFLMYQFKSNKEFYESAVKPTYNRSILFPIWIGVIVIIAITSILLYYKRDFA